VGDFYMKVDEITYDFPRLEKKPIPEEEKQEAIRQRIKKTKK